jgi:dihydrofolate reductase
MDAMFSVVVALDRNRGIGRDGRLPWKLSGDTRFFRELTTCPERPAVEHRYGLSAIAGSETPTPLAAWLAAIPSRPALPMPSPDCRNAVLMGRNTWEGLPPAYKPLPNRLNGVLSRQGRQDASGTHRVWGDLDQALEVLDHDISIREIFVIGGAQVYGEALLSPACGRIYLTDIDAEFACDAFFPEIPEGFRETASSALVEENGTRYRFRLLQRGPS